MCTRIGGIVVIILAKNLAAHDILNQSSKTKHNTQKMFLCLLPLFQHPWELGKEGGNVSQSLKHQKRKLGPRHRCLRVSGTGAVGGVVEPAPGLVLPQLGSWSFPFPSQTPRVLPPFCSSALG